jgi:hypothetical protein
MDSNRKIPPTRYYLDDGTEFNPDLFPKPSLCLTCRKNDDPNEELLCNLTRMDQRNEDEFKCFAYKKVSGNRKSTTK